MNGILYLKGSATGSLASEAINLANYCNAAGTGKSVLRISWADQYCDGTISSFVIQHSSDNSTYTNLWNVGTLSGDDYKTVYTFDEWIQAGASYVTGTDSDDPGVRIKITLDVYGLPDWPNVYVCRNEDMAAIFPRRMNVDNNFELAYPDQMRLAKRQIEQQLRGRGIDPNKAFTDGHNTYPTIDALRTAGAYLTWWFVNLDMSAIKGDDFYAEQDMLWQRYGQEFDMACSSGAMKYDTDEDGGLSGDSDSIAQSIIIYR